MHQGFCVRCKDMHMMEDPEMITIKNGRKAVQGSCDKCGTTINKFVGGKSMKGSNPMAATALAEAAPAIAEGVGKVAGELGQTVRAIDQRRAEERERIGKNDFKETKYNRQSLRMVQKEYRIMINRRKKGLMPAEFTDMQLWQRAERIVAEKDD